MSKSHGKEKLPLKNSCKRRQWNCREKHLLPKMHIGFVKANGFLETVKKGVAS